MSFPSVGFFNSSFVLSYFALSTSFFLSLSSSSLALYLLFFSAKGKTSLIRRYTKNEFSSNYQTTIGVDFSLKSLETTSGSLNVQLWDIAGSYVLTFCFFFASLLCQLSFVRDSLSFSLSVHVNRARSIHWSFSGSFSFWI
jgi:hypothetical protein